jgi:glycosyltransferase involved in cell wall biosynthesis
MADQQAHLVLSGLPLLNPYVGQGAYTLRLIAALQRRPSEKLVVVVPWQMPAMDQTIKAPMVRLPRRVLPNHGLAKQILLAGQLLRFVAREYPDAIFHSPGPIAGRARPRRTVVTIHDCIYRSFPYYLGRFLIRRIYTRATERFARSAALVLTDSEFSKGDIVSKLDVSPDKIQVLYPWVGQEFQTAIFDNDVIATLRRYGLPRQFWLYLGGYDYRKNVEVAIRAYAKVASSKSVPPLVLAGAIPAQGGRAACDVLGTLRSVSLSDRQVIMPGIIAGPDLPALYKAADLLIYPSLMEGFGLPPAEAMAVGTPVLSSNSSSLPEVVKNPNSLFDPRKEDDLAARLDEAARDTRQFVSSLSEKFTEQFGIKRYLDLIGQLSRE